MLAPETKLLSRAEPTPSHCYARTNTEFFSAPDIRQPCSNMTVLQVLSYPRENPEAAGISITIKLFHSCDWRRFVPAFWGKMLKSYFLPTRRI